MHVAGDESDVAEPGETARLCLVTRTRRYDVPSCEELRDEMAPDEASGTGDQHHHRNSRSSGIATTNRPPPVRTHACCFRTSQEIFHGGTSRKSGRPLRTSPGDRFA